MEQTVTAPVPVQRQRLFGILLPPAIPPVRVFSATARDALHYRIKDPDNASQKKSVTEQDYRYPLDAKAGLYPWARVGARNLAKSPRFSEPVGKDGVL